MTHIIRYPDGLSYLAVGIVLGVLLALRYGAVGTPPTAAARNVPEAEGEAADNVITLGERKRKAG